MNNVQQIAARLAVCGMAKSEALAYAAISQMGHAGVGSVAAGAGMPRASAYAALEALVRRGLVGKVWKSSAAEYFTDGPDQLVHDWETRLKDVQDGLKQVSAIAKDIAAARNFSKAPKVRMYDGVEGVKSALWDSLSAQETIRTVVNADEMSTHFPALNKEYLRARVSRKVPKRALVTDTPFGRAAVAAYDKSVTTSRICPDPSAVFRGETNIYDGKVAFVAYRENYPMGFLIEDMDFYRVMRSLFDALWEKSA